MWNFWRAKSKCFNYAIRWLQIICIEINRESQNWSWRNGIFHLAYQYHHGLEGWNICIFFFYSLPNVSKCSIHCRSFIYSPEQQVNVFHCSPYFGTTPKCRIKKLDPVGMKQQYISHIRNPRGIHKWWCFHAVAFLSLLCKRKHRWLRVWMFGVKCGDLVLDIDNLLVFLEMHSFK